MTDCELFITPAALRSRLAPLGYDPGERTLSLWRRRRALPSLDRRPPRPGSGPGSVWGWTDPHIAVQVCTLQVARHMHARVDQWMKLAAWFAGFDYPIHQIRPAWTWLCRHTGVDAASRELGWPPISDSERPEAVQALYHRFPRKRRRPAAMATLQAGLDPTFTGPTQSQLDDARRWFLDDQHQGLPNGVGDVFVRAGFSIERILGPTGVETTLAEVTDDQLVATHRDARVLLTPFRLVAAELIDEGDGAAVGTLLRFLIGVGRQVHTAALALRHAGHGDRLDATIDQAQALGGRSEVQEAFWAAVEFMRDTASLDPGDRSAGWPPPEALQRFEKYSADVDLLGAFSSAWAALAETWADVAGPIIDAFVASDGAAGLSELGVDGSLSTLRIAGVGDGPFEGFDDLRASPLEPEKGDSLD